MPRPAPRPENIVPRSVVLLAHLAEMIDRLADLEHEAVGLARDAGATWEAIGEEQGISGQNARRKYERRRLRRPGRSSQAGSEPTS